MSDFIRRDDVINALKDVIINLLDDSPYCYDYWSYIKEIINGIPAVTPKQKTGKWIRNNTYHGDNTSGYVDPDWRCSECGKNAPVNEWFMYDLTAFCPNCGAKMEFDHDTN